MLTSVFAAPLLASLLLVVGLLTAPIERWFYGADDGTRRKLIGYGATIGVLWTLTLAALWICGWEPLLHSSVAMAAWLPAPPAAPIAGTALGAVVAAYFIVAMLPFFQSLRGPRWRAAYAAAIRRVFAALPGLLPNTAAERSAFLLLSLSAGVCEEVLYRGFLIRFLHEGALALPITGALAVSSLAFGLGHAYQGFKGVLSTTVAGLGMGLLFLLSGSLIPVMVLHAVIDMQIVYVLLPVSGSRVPAAA